MPFQSQAGRVERKQRLALRRARLPVACPAGPTFADSPRPQLSATRPAAS